MTKRPRYDLQVTSRDGVLEQHFVANYTVVEKHDGQWLLAFGDLIGPEALGNKRPPAHSLLVYVGPEEGPRSPWRLSVEFNDQGNTRHQDQIERFEMNRTGIEILTLEGDELWAGRVTYTPEADPFEPHSDREGPAIRRLRVDFQCDDATYGKMIGALGRADPGDWLKIERAAARGR